MIRRVRDRVRDDRGATAVELAVVTPFILALLVGAIEIGMMFDRTQELESAARDAARFAAADVDATKSEIETRVTDALDGLTGVSVTVDPDTDSPCDGRPGDPVVISAQFTDTLTLLFVSSASIDLGGSASFACTTDQ